MPTTPNLGLREYGTGDVVDSTTHNANLTILDNALASGASLRAIAVLTSGNVALGAAGDVGISVTFTASRTQNIEVRFYGVFQSTVPSSGFAGTASMLINLDAGATEYTFNPWNEVNGAGGDYTNNANACCGCVFASVAAGSHTIKMRGAGLNTILLANTTTPATMVIEYQ